MERDVEFELTPSSTSPSEQVVHTLRGGSDNGRGRWDDGLSRESKSALTCLMLAVRRIRWWRWDCQTNERSLTKPSVLYPRSLFYSISFISLLVFYSRMQSRVHIRSEVIPKAWKILAKEFLWRLLCVHFLMRACVCVCVCKSLWSLLIASERLTALIEAHRTPSTPHLHGKAAKTQAVTTVVILNLKRSTLDSKYQGNSECGDNTLRDVWCCSPSSPTAAPSPSSLWLQPSVSPPGGAWLPLLHQCPSASGSSSRLSTTCTVTKGKSDRVSSCILQTGSLMSHRRDS